MIFSMNVYKIDVRGYAKYHIDQTNHEHIKSNLVIW